jgi:hypothetical protein
MKIKYLSTIHDGTPNSMGETILPGAIKKGLDQQVPIYKDSGNQGETERNLIGYGKFYYGDVDQTKLMVEANILDDKICDVILFCGHTFLTPFYMSYDSKADWNGCGIHSHLEIQHGNLSTAHSRDDIKNISKDDVVEDT